MLEISSEEMFSLLGMKEAQIQVLSKRALQLEEALVKEREDKSERLTEKDSERGTERGTDERLN